jgi:hypothetical protein
LKEYFILIIIFNNLTKFAIFILETRGIKILDFFNAFHFFSSLKFIIF